MVVLTALNAYLSRLSVSLITTVLSLLALGYSARLEDVELYDNNRARCTVRFVSLVAEANAFVNTATM
jgi:hypothetical protein